MAFGNVFQVLGSAACPLLCLYHNWPRPFYRIADPRRDLVTGNFKCLGLNPGIGCGPFCRHKHRSLKNAHLITPVI